MSFALTGRIFHKLHDKISNGNGFHISVRSSNLKIVSYQFHGLPFFQPRKMLQMLHLH